MTNFEYDDDFYSKVKHNFKLYVLLSCKKVQWKEDILDSLYGMNGYKCHKTVKYGRNTSHIHVKFEEECLAKKAVDLLNRMNSDLTAILLDDMLRDWYTYEIKSGLGPPCTLTIVDIVGRPPLALNFLTNNILSSIFEDFGGMYLLPYTAALSDPHVQVLFNSMTEALAACMAFGEWYNHGVKVDSFSHRVRINPSHKEATLIRNSGGTPKEAFQLDYFVNVRTELIQSPRRSEPDANQNKKPRSKKLPTRDAQKGRKNKPETPSMNAAHQSNLTNQVGRMPILCVPVIAPLNYTDAFMNASGLGADFANTILNIQRSYSVSASARTIVASGQSETEISSTVQYCSSEESLECDEGKKQNQQIEQEAATALIPAKPELDLAPRKPIQPTNHPADKTPKRQAHHAVKKQKTFCKGTSKVFERRR